MSQLLSFEDARDRLLAQAAAPDAIETIPLMEADGRVLARGLVSTLNVPAWDNAQMDGYAVRTVELAGGDVHKVFRVSQRIAAGHQGRALEEGTVARIFTGAPLPSGADAVVMQEQVRVVDGGVCFDVVPRSGDWVRRTAEDIEQGAEILSAGTRLAPAAVGLAASVGIAEVPVYVRPRVACFFTGDELVMPGRPLPPGSIYNSNRFVLNALLKRLGCEVHDLGIVEDDREATRQALRRAARQADLIITAGGVSVGEEDHVRPAVEAEGEIDLWRLAIKPGKPLAYGRVRRPDAEGRFAHFIGLPGNPVSAFVTFLTVVRPFVLKLQGVQNVLPKAVMAVSGFEWSRPDMKRREFLCASLQPDSRRVTLFRNQGSAVMTSAVAGDGLIDNPVGQSIRPGDPVRFLPFPDLLN
ncbi:MAG: molybdopterin molybdotransferase MoeA [Lautropia sp.]|nr:molybdopterin molybdotransferase MoeA [Lautropia sp.]